MTIKRTLFTLFGTSFAASLFAAFSWQQPQAQIDPKGDLSWSPQPFEFEAGETVRYIDFENGDDANDGASKAKPWKHHPWDANASGNAADFGGVATYVFKGGVTYRGFLEADDSGTADEPLRLTRDPSWGKGEAVISGAEPVAAQWQKATAADVPEGMPAEGVWFVDLGADAVEPWAVWQVSDDGSAERVHIARDPNWTLSNPADPKHEWAEWTWPSKKERAIGSRKAADEALKGKPENFYEGVYCWSEWGGGRFGAMSLQYRSPVTDYDPEKGALDRVVISPIFDGWAVAGDRYFLEKHPSYLDAPGEYYFDAPTRVWPTAADRGFPWEVIWKEANPAHPGRLYVRLPGDANPNQATVEVGVRDQGIRILDQDHIEISGLTFSRFNVPYRPQHPNLPGWDGYDIHTQLALETYLEPAAIILGGDTSYIRVANNRFYHVPAAVKGQPWRAPLVEEVPAFPALPEKQSDEFGDIDIVDNDVQFVDHEGIALSGRTLKQATQQGTPTLGRVGILRNRMHHISLRPKQSKMSPAIFLHGGVTLAEIAGNEMIDCYGMGIYTVGGKGGGDERTIPLIRVLIHQNKADHAMISANDWGQIAHWQGGPGYIFNNAASNATGYKNHIYRAWDKEGPLPRYVSNAYPYYGDGTYKSYWFNNIATSDYDPETSVYRTQAAFMFVLGFQNHVFNSSAYNMYDGNSGSIGNRGGYYGNIYAHMSDSLIGGGSKGDISVAGGGEAAVELNMGAISATSYTQNLLADTRSVDLIGKFGFGTWRDDTYEKKLAAMRKENPLRGDVGTVVNSMPFTNPDEGNFQPIREVANVEGARSAKLFVPWGLYATVGEWQFHANTDVDPRLILGRNFYMTDEYVQRNMYYEIPRNDLLVPAATAGSYQPGLLANWIDSALQFDGTEIYGMISHERLTESYPVSMGFVDRKKEDGTVTRAEMESQVKAKAAYDKAVESGKENQIRRAKRKLDNMKKRGAPEELFYPGEKRQTVSIDTGNLLIEAHLRTESGHTSGVIAGKMGESAGYQLRLGADGKPVLVLASGGEEERFSADQPINSGDWHHLIAEIDRESGEGTFYIDGKAAGSFKSNLPADASLANTADFLVGKGTDGDYFAGAMDFLRVCRGTLADAQTSIEELYAWQFDGPFLKDFAGQRRNFENGAPGALEFE